MRASTMRQIEDKEGERHKKSSTVEVKQRSQFHKLIEACKRKDLNVIKQILEEHPELLNQHDKFHRNLLHYTSILILDGGESGDDDDQRDQRSRKSDNLDQQDDERMPRAGREQLEKREHARCLDCFRFLLNKCDHKLWVKRDQDGLTALHLAVISCNVPLVREILFAFPPEPTQSEQARGCKWSQEQLDLSRVLISALDKEHHSPLHWAVITNNLECVKLLIQHSGVQLAHQPDLNGATPLHYATQTSDYPKYRQQLRLMLKNATSSCSPSSSNASQHSPGSSPATSKTTRADNHSSCSSSPLSSCDLPNANQVVSTTGTKSKLQQRQQQQQLSEISCRRGLEEGGGAKEEEDEVARKRRRKLARNESTDINNNNNNSMSLDAQSSSHVGTCESLDILQFLAQLAGVNLEVRDRDLRTPLLWAASSGNRRAIMLLLRSGANPLCQDANKLGPLHCSASHGFTDCLESFLASSSSFSSSSSSRVSQLALQQVNQADNLACTPLFYAVLSGNIDCVELLLERGARHDWQDVKGRTAAHFAALKGQLSTLKLLESRGANLWLANKQGDLPLHYAIKSGRQQVVAWLLEHSPYERAVNAINNAGRAPIHLAILKSNPTLVDFLIKRGANLNQLVKVKDKQKVASTELKDASTFLLKNGADSTRGSSTYHYETALDMARRLGQRECLELLTRSSAQPATWVLAKRQEQQQQRQQKQQQVAMRASEASGDRFQGASPQLAAARSLFDLRAAEIASSPIGFETSGSSAEPPQLDERQLGAATTGAQAPASRLPKLPNRPEPLESMAPLSESSNSSALSQSSLTSVRVAKPQVAAGAQHDWRGTTGPSQRKSRLTTESSGEPPNKGQQQQQQRAPASIATGRPYRGGINYHNERINASIKCKLYENQTSDLGHQSFPPLGESQRARQQRGEKSRNATQYHSAGSLAPATGGRLAVQSPGGGGGQQEIITNVNVYTSSPRCVQCLACEDEMPERCPDCAARRRATHAESAMAAKDASGPRQSLSSNRARKQRQQQIEPSETSDTSDATSEIMLYDDGGEEDDEEEEEEESDHSATNLPPLEPEVGPIAAKGQQQQVRYLPPSRAYTQHLPVILSAAEEERSTSCETNNGQPDNLPHGNWTGREDAELRAAQAAAGAAAVDKQAPQGTVLGDPVERRFSRAQGVRAQARRVDRYREQARSPVAEYIRGNPDVGQRGDVRGVTQRQQQQQQEPFNARTDYSQVRAKVDSHRNDSGLSSHFGDDLDGSSSVGRRSKSWSTLSNQQQQQQQQQGAVGQGRESGDFSPAMDAYGAQAEDLYATQEAHSRSCSRQTIIRTRRLSVDSVELASSVEKSIRKYRQENKLFEELQNLKRSQIRSGRANEALLVKRLVERFRHEIQRDTLNGLDPYHGPYTYQAYELYLYDQLRKISQSNGAKLAGARAPHKFSYHHEQEPQLIVDQSTLINYETRDFLEEDLKAELELQRVLARSEAQARATRANANETPATTTLNRVLIEPSGALEDIRVRLKDGQIQLASAGEKNALDAAAGEELAKEEERATFLERQENGEPREDAAKADQEPGDGKLEEGVPPASLHDSRTAFSGSSAASSRRSSVEIEREKLERIPLRVGELPQSQSVIDDGKKEDDEDENCSLSSLAGEKERRQIEAQAIDLTAAIITDALGNVSRASSPVGERKKVSTESARKSSEQDIDGAVDSGELRTQEEEVEQHEQDSERVQQFELARGRRRSVVNIGNKIEVIYHDVGIEIDTVGESQPSDDEEPAVLSQEHTGPGDADEREEVHEELELKSLQEDEKDKTEEAKCAEEQQGDKQEEDESALTGSGTPKADETSFNSEAADTESSESSVLSRASSISRAALGQTRGKQAQDAGELETPAHSLRRASSPSTGPPKKTTAGTRLAPSRHSSVDSYYPTTSDMIVVQRKVFNGFDLDSLRAHRRKQMAASRAGDEQSDIVKSQGRVSSKLARVTRPSTKRRLARSRPPAGPYKVYVPTELIHERWLGVKRCERQRKRLLELERASFHLAHTSSDAGAQNNQHRRQVDGVGVIVPHARSQPNLTDDDDESFQKRQQQLASHFEHEAGANQDGTQEDDDCSNFVLIYELNKLSRRTLQAQRLAGDDERKVAQGRERQKEGQSETRRRAQEVKWCQKRMTKIIDVRALKRTLSLPESLIYSNDLLKRFNILKL